MTKPVTIPNTFATATTAIPLSQLDSDFSTVATALNDANTYSNYAADTGVANAYVVTLTGVSTTYSAGLRIQFKAGNANTGASTLNVNGGGTKNITFQDASALSSGTIAANAIVDVMYDGTQFLLMNDPAGATGGDVVGPASATDNAIARFDGTSGKIIQNSAVTVADTTGDITGGKYNGLTITTSTGTLTIANGKTLTANNTLTLSGTDSTTMTFPSTNATIARTDSAQTFTGVQTFSSNPILSGGTANGVLYLNGSSVATSGSALTFDGTKLVATATTGAATTYPAYFDNSGGGVGTGVRIGFRNTGASYGEVGYLYDGTFATIIDSAGSGSTRLLIGGTEQMRLTSTGLVIGTTSTSQKLRVYDSGSNTVIRAENGTSAFEIQSNSNDGYINMNGTGNIVFRNGSGFTERARITSGGDLQIANGNLVMSTSGKGIDFSATSSGTGTMTSELLSDYEEGTWTPTAYGSSTAGTTTYTLQQGSYTKIGNQVTVSVRIAWSALTGTGELTFGGFPFASANNSMEYMGSIMTNELNWDGGTYLQFYKSSNTTTGVIFYIADDVIWNVQQCTNERASIRFTVTYFV